MNRKGWMVFLVGVTCIAVLAVVGMARALAADAPPAPDVPAGAPAGAPEAAPAPAAPAPPAAPVEPATKARQARTTVLDTIQKGGYIGHTIIFLSFIALALIIEHSVTIRRDKLCPPELATELEDYFNQEQYEEALELCNVEHNLLTDVVRAGLSRIDSGYERMQEAMQEAGEEASVNLQTKISYLSLIGNISPMLGLLGTVNGMVGAFGKIAIMPVVKPAILAGNINEALVTTLEGLMVAIPVMCAYQFFSNRVVKLVLESSTIVNDLMERFKPAK